MSTALARRARSRRRCVEGDPRESSDDTRRDRDREASPRGRRGVGADGSALRRVRRSQLFVVLGRVLHHRAARASKWRAARRPRAAPGRRPETGDRRPVGRTKQKIKKKRLRTSRTSREDVTTARRARRDESRAGEVLARRPGRALL